MGKSLEYDGQEQKETKALAMWSVWKEGCLKIEKLFGRLDFAVEEVLRSRRRWFCFGISVGGCFLKMGALFENLEPNRKPLEFRFTTGVSCNLGFCCLVVGGVIFSATKALRAS